MCFKESIFLHTFCHFIDMRPGRFQAKKTFRREENKLKVRAENNGKKQKLKLKLKQENNMFVLAEGLVLLLTIFSVIVFNHSQRWCQ